jgi:hypothetical protein
MSVWSGEQNEEVDILAVPILISLTSFAFIAFNLKEFYKALHTEPYFVMHCKEGCELCDRCPQLPRP